MRIRASSLSYAILFVTIGGMILMSLILLVGYGKEFEIKTDKELRQHQFAYSCSNYFLDHLDPHYVNHQHDTCFSKFSSWGTFQILHSFTRNKSKVYENASLIGGKRKFDYCLFIRESDRRIKLGGKTKISGDVRVSRLGFERAYIASKRYENDALLYGENLISNKQLPAISDSVFSLDCIKNNVRPIDFWENVKKERAYTHEPIWLQSSDYLELTDTLKGQFLIQSFDSIVVRNTAVLEGVILQAPKVIIEKGFTGSLQVLASQHVLIGENVNLDYPSSIVLKEETYNLDDGLRGVEVREGAKVNGGILLYSVDANFRKPVTLKIAPSTLITGLVYCSGNAQVQGEIIGTGIFNQVNYKSKGGSYQNTLIDFVISDKKLPENYIYPSFLNDDDSKIVEYERIKWL